MSKKGRYRDRVTLTTFTTVKGADGYLTPTDTVVGTFGAWVRSMSLSKKIRAGLEAQDIVYEIDMDFRNFTITDISNTFVTLQEGTKLKIHTFEDVDRLGRTLRIIAIDG